MFSKSKYLGNSWYFLPVIDRISSFRPCNAHYGFGKTLFKHRVNRDNFYCKNPNESVQNIAVTVKDFLSTMPSFINKSIKFGLYQDIYLTEQQMKAIGHVNEDGEFCPKRQLIFWSCWKWKIADSNAPGFYSGSNQVECDAFVLNWERTSPIQAVWICRGE